MTNMEKKIIACSKLFRNLEWDESMHMIESQMGMVKEFFKGEVLISPDEPFRYLGVVVSGEIDVVRIHQDGNQHQVHLLKPKSVIGAEMVGNGTILNPYFYIARSDVRMFMLPIENVIKPGRIPEKLRQKIFEAVLGILVHENYRQQQKVDIISVINLRERICRYLSYQQIKRNTNPFEIPYSREQMADYLCVNRSALSRELSRMQKEGLIKYHKNKFEILK